METVRTCSWAVLVGRLADETPSVVPISVGKSLFGKGESGLRGVAERGRCGGSRPGPSSDLLVELAGGDCSNGPATATAMSAIACFDI